MGWRPACGAKAKSVWSVRVVPGPRYRLPLPPLSLTRRPSTTRTHQQVKVRLRKLRRTLDFDFPVTRAPASVIETARPPGPNGMKDRQTLRSSVQVFLPGLGVCLAHFPTHKATFSVKLHQQHGTRAQDPRAGSIKENAVLCIGKSSAWHAGLLPTAKHPPRQSAATIAPDRAASFMPFGPAGRGSFARAGGGAGKSHKSPVSHQSQKSQFGWRMPQQRTLQPAPFAARP